MSTAVRMPFLATCSAQQHQRMSTTYQHAFHACRAFNSNSQTAIQTGCKQAAQPHALEFLWETCYNTLFNTFNTSVNQWNQCGMIKQRRLCQLRLWRIFSAWHVLAWHPMPCNQLPYSSYNLGQMQKEKQQKTLLPVFFLGWPKQHHLHTFIIQEKNIPLWPCSMVVCL